MKAISIEKTGQLDANNRMIVNATVVASSEPASLPVTGENVDGMDGQMVFAPMSVMYVTDTAASHQVYIANESGTFIGQ